MNCLGFTSGAIGVHSIDHFALTVPDLGVAKHFFTEFGLDVRGVDGELQLRAGDGHLWGRIRGGDRKFMRYLELNCFEDALLPIREQLAIAGARPAEADKGYMGTSQGYWFNDPDGNLLHVKVGPKTMPMSKTPNLAVNIPSNARGSINRSKVATIRPTRLSHVLLFSPDVPRTVKFYLEGLGLRLSDCSLDLIAFTHAPHGSDHHLVAFAKSQARGWHHSSWEVKDVDEVGLGAAQMEAAGYAEGWGTGRHVLGSNYFNYVRDPWGSFAEYSAHIDFIEAGHKWPSGDHPPEDSLYQWGPALPPWFIKNTEIDSA